MQACLGPALLLSASPALHQDSVLWLEGDSTLHRFSSTSTAMSAEIEGPALDQIRKLVVHIPVDSLKSEKAQLDRNLHQALGSEKYPEIIFRMKSYEMKPSTAAVGASRISAKGELIIAGRSRESAIEALAKSDQRGARVEGSHDLLMTDFGIKPPSMMMGAVKTRNEVTVRYILYFDFTKNK